MPELLRSPSHRSCSSPKDVAPVHLSSALAELFCRGCLFNLPGVMVARHQNVTFQQIGGRLLVARSSETSSETVQAAVHSTDEKAMKVTVDR